MEIKGIDKWILPAYKPYMLDYDTRINVFYGGAGSGKSFFMCQKIIIKALRSERKILVVRKVGATIKSSIWDLILEILSRMPQVIESINKAEMQITLINGSKFIFKGLDDSEKIKSITAITDIVIEEATEITLDDFTQLNLRLRSKKPHNQIHMAFNPVSKANWVFKYFFENGAPDNCRICKTTYKDNAHLPKEYIDSILELEQRNPAYFKIYVKGEFATLDKLVFPIVEKRPIKEEELKRGWFWCGMDFGYTNDPTAITWGYYVPSERILYIVGEFDEKGLTNDKIAENIERLGLIKEVITADSAEPKSIAELRKLGVRRIRSSVKGADSVKNGIDQIQRMKIIIDPICIHTIEEFENYTWKKDKSTGEYINQPIDMFNHHIDSIRYGIQAVMNKKRNADEEGSSSSMFL